MLLLLTKVIFICIFIQAQCFTIKFLIYFKIILLLVNALIKGTLCSFY